MMRFFFWMTLLGISVGLNAQTTADALRFSNVNISGTARALAVGGSMSAFGTDFSVLSSNPAGIGAYRFSEFVVSPALLRATGKGLLENDPNAERARNGYTDLNLSTIGVVLVGNLDEESNWRTFNFGVGLNQVADFTQAFKFEGRSSGSIIDRFWSQANTIGLDNFESGVAFDANAIYDVDDDGFYESDFEFAGNPIIERSQEIERSGSSNELLVGLGGNYMDRLMLGMSIGFTFLKFEERKIYRERDPNNSVDNFENLRYDETLLTDGSGVNLKLGMIYRLNQQFRVGLSIHTPTAYQLNDTFSTAMDYTYSESGELFSSSAESRLGTFDYRLRTPWRYIGSVGILVGYYGFLSAEVEFIDFGTAKFKLPDTGNPLDDEYEVILNEAVNTDLANVISVRVGGEFLWRDFRFRGGVGLSSSTLVEEELWNTAISAGLGYRAGQYFFDLGYKIESRENTYSPYAINPTISEVQRVQNNFTNQQIILTLGAKF